MIFKVEIVETLTKIVLVDAKDEEKAKDLVCEEYRQGEIILDWSDYVDTDFHVSIAEPEDLNIYNIINEE